jgi:cytochrome P450
LTWLTYAAGFPTKAGMALPPGPRWPALFQTVALLRSGQAFIARASARYGDLFTVRTLVFGAQVFTSDPALIKQIFTGDPDDYHAGEANSSALLLTGERSVLVLDGAPHRRARRLLMPPFHGERMHAYAEAMRSITEGVLSTFRAGDSFPLLPALQRITLEVIVANVFGLPPGPRRDHFATTLGAIANRVASPLGAFFVLPALQRDLGPLYPWRRLKAELDAFNALIYGEIAERRALYADPGAPRRDDILSLLLETRDEDGQPMMDQEIRDQLVTLLAGGHETTASSLAWAFERILAHPEVADRLVAEIDAAVAEGRTAAADLGELPYLDATVKEVLRQRPSVPQIGRRLTRPMVLRDHEIPAGAMVSPSIFLTHRRPDLYPDPEAFRPERFLGKKTDPYTYLPFGGGPRRCLGAAFATQEMKIVLGTVLHRWRLQLVDRPPLPVAPRSFFFAPAGGTRVRVLGPRLPS